MPWDFLLRASLQPRYGYSSAPERQADFTLCPEATVEDTPTASLQRKHVAPALNESELALACQRRRQSWRI